MSYSLGVILLFTFAIMIAGVVAGVIAGLLGVGGGIVLVPILFYLFIALGVDESVRMHLAVGTSLTTIVATAASSTRAHYARGSIDTTLLHTRDAWLFIGAVLGMVVFSSINTASDRKSVV